MPQLFLRGTLLGDVQGVLFDKDGTLANSEKRLINLAKLRVNESIRIYRKINDNEKDLLKLNRLLCLAYGIRSNGISAGGLSAIASRDSNLTSTATIFCVIGESWSRSLDLSNQIFNSVDRLISIGKVPEISNVLLPGAKKMLMNFQNAGISLSLISNDTKKGILTFIRLNKLEAIFQNYWSAEDYPPKPNPNAILKFCECLKMKPSECALIGDSDTDLLMAQRSKMKIVLGYTGGWTDPPVLYEYDHLIEHWDELRIR